MKSVYANSHNESDHVTFTKWSWCKFNSKPTLTLLGGAFDPFNNYTNPSSSQAFEDTGVRAYKGQATNLISTRFTYRCTTNPFR
jgi:hypothetical protein